MLDKFSDLVDLSKVVTMNVSGNIQATVEADDYGDAFTVHVYSGLTDPLYKELTIQAIQNLLSYDAIKKEMQKIVDHRLDNEARKVKELLKEVEKRTS